MRTYLKNCTALLLVAALIAGCGGGSSDSSSSSEKKGSDTTAMDNSSSSDETSAPAEDTSSDSSSSSDDMIAKIGYGHFMDSNYIEVVSKNMNGNQRNQYSEAQLFNYARNTCTDLKAGNEEKILKLMKSVKNTVDYSFFANMTIAAIVNYCMANEEPFMSKAKAAGL
jgi:hypothetical protein